MKTAIALGAAAALFASAPPAAAQSADWNLRVPTGLGLLAGVWVASSVTGAVTLVGTGVAAAQNGESQRGWGMVSAVTGAANLSFSVLFGVLLLVGALAPEEEDGEEQVGDPDPRVVIGVISGINGVIGASNVALAVFTLTRKQAAPDARALAFAVQPAALPDAQGDAAPGLVLVGRF